MVGHLDALQSSAVFCGDVCVGWGREEVIDYFLSKISFMNTIKVSNSLDPYHTLVNVYVDLLVFTRIAGTS